MKLTLATCLGPFVAEHRPAIPEALHPLAEQAVLNHGAHHGGGPFRPQCAAAITAITEGVHLLAHHIRGLADAASEELGGLQNGGADLLQGRPLEMAPGGGLNVLPEGGVLRQQIHHAPEALELLHAFLILSSCCHLLRWRAATAALLRWRAATAAVASQRAEGA